MTCPGNFDDVAEGLQQRLAQDFARFGLALDGLYVTSITPPVEVQQAIDDRSRMSVIKDMDNFVRMKAAMAMEKAAAGGGEAGAGLGLGLGMMMPAMFAGLQTNGNRAGGGKPAEVEWPGVRQHDSGPGPFLSLLRPPATAQSAVRQLRQKPAAKRRFLPQVRSSGGGTAG